MATPESPSHFPEEVSTVVDASVVGSNEYLQEIEIIEDEPYPGNYRLNRCSKLCFGNVDRWIGLCTLLMSVLAVVGGLFVAVLIWKDNRSLSSNDDDDGSSKDFSETLLPLHEYYAVLFEELDTLGVLGLKDPSTATYEALEWMAFQDGAVFQFTPDQIPAIQQRYAVAAMFFATAGADFWDANWLGPGTNECEFSGLSCDERGHLVSLELHQRSLIGAIPLELSWLTHLTKLDVRQNRLYGSVPSGIFSTLTKLNYFDLSFNELTGSLPADWSALTLLTEMNCQANSFTGSVPTALPPYLEYINWNANLFTGTLPSAEWMSNHNHATHPLRMMDLSDNNINGTLEDGVLFSLFPGLVSLGFHSTDLGGSLPTELGLLPLEELALTQTHISGTLPAELFAISTLQWLVLSRTDISGTMPTGIGQLSELKVLNLVETYISGTIPTELGLLHRLEWLQLSETGISGTIPTELGQLEELSKLCASCVFNN